MSAVPLRRLAPAMIDGSRRFRPSGAGSAATAAIALLMLGACDEPTGPGEGDAGVRNECVRVGRRAVNAQSATWRRENGPYFVADSVTIGVLHIEPGVRICATGGGRLVVSGRILAIGTRSDSILFLAAEADGQWGGLRIGLTYDNQGPLSRLRHVRFEGGGIEAHNPLELDSSVVRSGGVAFKGTMRNVRVESGSVTVPAYYSGTLENVTVLNSPGAGVSVSRRAGIRLNGVRIEGSQGPGFSAHAFIGGEARVEIDGPLRITGGASYPAYGPIDMVDQLFRHAGSVDSLTGNAHDVLVLGGIGENSEPVTITAALPWRIEDGGGCICGALRQVHMEAGASLTVEWAGLSGFIIDGLSVEGTPDRKATIRGAGGQYPESAVRVFIGNEGAESIQLRGLLLDNVDLTLSDAVPAVIEDITGTRSSIDAPGTGSTLNHVHLRDARRAAVVLGPATALAQASITGSAAEGIVVRGADVRVSDCIVGGNDGYGIHVDSGNAVISRCSLLANRREAVFNSTATPVDARSNWWGSPDGPGAPGAGSTGGLVDYLPFLDQPPEQVGSTAASVEIVRILPVATSDTTTLIAEVRDAAGDLLPFANVVWSIEDPALATVFADGLAVGLVAGVTSVTATVSGDTALRATQSLEVLPGAPVYDWTRHQLDGLITTVAAVDGVMFVGAWGGTVHRHDGSEWTSHAFEDANGDISIWARTASDAYAVMHSVDPNTNTTMARLYHFDGSSWTYVREFEGFTWAMSGTDASDLFVGGTFGMWHYDGQEWHHRITTPFSSMAAHSPTDVYFSGSIDSDYGVRHFDGVTIRDVGGPAGLLLWRSDDALFGAGSRDFDLYRYHGPSDWRGLPSDRPLRARWVDGNTATDVFTMTLSGSLWHYGGAKLQPVWLGGFSPLLPEWIDVDGDHVYIADYAGSVFVGERRTFR